MLKVGIIVGSTRPNRNGRAVAEWVLEHARDHRGAEFHLVDIADFDLPLLDEPLPASGGQYSKEHTKHWARTIDALDAFVFVTPEYNHSTSGALKNAIDFIYAEWNNKAAGFVSYGSAGGTRAVEHLRGIMAELQIADVRGHVVLSLFDDFEDFSNFNPRDVHESSLAVMLDQLIAWGAALKQLRSHPEPSIRRSGT